MEFVLIKQKKFRQDKTDIKDFPQSDIIPSTSANTFAVNVEFALIKQKKFRQDKTQVIFKISNNQASFQAVSFTAVSQKNSIFVLKLNL